MGAREYGKKRAGQPKKTLCVKKDTMPEMASCPNGAWGALFRFFQSFQLFFPQFLQFNLFGVVLYQALRQ